MGVGRVAPEAARAFGVAGLEFGAAGRLAADQEQQGGAGVRGDVRPYLVRQWRLTRRATKLAIARPASSRAAGRSPVNGYGSSP